LALARKTNAALAREAIPTIDVALFHLCCDLKPEFTLKDALGFLHRYNGGWWEFAADPKDP
jgi:hypothetical protein